MTFLQNTAALLAQKQEFCCCHYLNVSCLDVEAGSVPGTSDNSLTQRPLDERRPEVGALGRQGSQAPVLFDQEAFGSSSFPGGQGHLFHLTLLNVALLANHQVVELIVVTHSARV